MAKRKAKPAARATRPARKASPKRRSATRKTAAKSSAKRAGAGRSGASGRSSVKKRATARRKTTARSTAPKASARKTAKARGTKAETAPTRRARLDRQRRTLDDTVQTPPSSLDMDRHGSAARTGRAEMEESRRDHPGMGGVSGGDPDVDVDQAYFSGEEAPGGDNPTPDQDIVDDIGKALGVEYEDNEELKASDKVVERDRHRWELDPASSEDYKERK